MKIEWVEHIVKEGSREHVLHWDSNGTHCSEPNCEVNKPYDGVDTILKVLKNAADVLTDEG